MAVLPRSVTIFYLIFLCVIITEGRQRKNKIEIKALTPEHTAHDCDLDDLQALSTRCNRQINGPKTEEYTTCHVPGNGTILEYQCIEGTWKPSTGTDSNQGYHLRNKRFWSALFGLLTAVVTLVTVIYCTEKYGNKQCEQTEVKADSLVPPEYTTCPPSDIKSEYTADRKQKKVTVTWSDPQATDDKEIISNEQTCCGYKSGDDFPGLAGDGRPHTITYTAKDSHGLSASCSFSFYVKYLACNEPAAPPNGRKNSCPDGYIYGGECTFECYTGYEMVGSNKATCQQDGTWDNTPECQKVTCEAPFDVTNGIIACDDPRYPFDDDCMFTCNEGFKLDGPSKMTCQADRTWSVDESKVSCVDDEAPVIACESPQVFYADRDSFGTSVIWTEPTATDNVDSNPSIIQSPGLSQGQTLMEGYHYVTYKATDSHGNSYTALSECSITLEVKVIKCSSGPIDALEVPRFMTYTCSDTSFYNGVSCQLDCDLNLPLNGTDLMTCERDGITDKGIWSWGSGHQPFCDFVECPPLDPPANGAMTTDSINSRPLHVMLCEDGYDIPSVGSAFQGRLSCQDSGEWYPLEAFPECIVATLPWLNLPAELYYEGDCNDIATQELIKEQILDYLSTLQADIDQSICPNVDTCKVGNVVVVCGDTSRRKRRSDARSVTKRHSVTKRQTTGYALVSFDISVLFDKGNQTIQEKYINLSDVLNDIKEVIQADVNSGDLDIAGFTLPTDAFQTNTYPDLLCDSGFFVDTGNAVCKPCPPGTYLNSSTGTCEYCGVGKYMDHEGALLCDECPEGYSTLYTGSKTIDKCIRFCSPGFFSSSTMEPCSACPVGAYQNHQGQDHCLVCTAGTATNKSNSISEEDCDFFDILVGQVSTRTEIGTFSTSGAKALSVSVWLKGRNNDVPSVSFFIEDSALGDVISLSSSEVVSVGFHESLPLQTNVAVSSESWTHIMINIDVTSGALEIYINGQLVASDTGSTQDSSRNVSTGNVQILSNSKGVYISGLSVYDRHLSSDDMTSLTQTCAVTLSDEIFSMTDILSNIVDGIAVITPTGCDPVDECANNPCGNHTCVNKVNDFECICHGGMTGALCDIPPDYCQDHGCVHGNCLPDIRTYTCNCTEGYTGLFCDTPPIDGGWSQWVEWSGCDVTCGGGTRARTRSCNNPSPGYMGQDCAGNDEEIETCNEDICPTCPQLKRKIGAIVSCTRNDSRDLEECRVTCEKGNDLTNGQKSFEKYWCGQSTNYEWMPINKIPDCVKVSKPDFLGIQTSVSYQSEIPDSARSAVETSVTQKVSGVDCVKNGLCNVTSSVSDPSRKRRSTASSLTLQFTISLTETGDLNIAEYLTNGTETTAMTELLDTLNTISDVIEFVQNNTESIFEVTVGGVEYTLESDSTNIVATVTCPSGYAGAGGLCAVCPAGTKLEDTACYDCEVGTYQPLTGQNTCLSCPAGYTTSTYGASDISECSVMFNDDDDDDDNDEDHSGGNKSTVIIVAVVVSSILFVFLVVVLSIILWKNTVRRRFRRKNTRGSFASLSMVRSASSLSNNVYTNARTVFNTGKIEESISSYPQPHLPPLNK